MGHAGAIISGEKGRAADKKPALTDSVVTVSESLEEIGVTLKKLLG